MNARRLRYRSAITLETLRSPRVELLLPDSPTGRRRQAQLAAPHPTLKLVSNGFGTALMPVPPSMDGYLEGRSRTLLRRKRRLARSTGFTFTSFDGIDHLQALLAIHRSMPARQGQPMQAAYLDPDAVRLYVERAGPLIGAFDANGDLKAYAHSESLGQVGSFQRLIGHADCLDAGVVYCLASEVVADFISQFHGTGQPAWLICGNLWSNGPGLAYFKRRIGFKPYRVRFRLEPS